MKPRISGARKIEFEEIYILQETIWEIGVFGKLFMRC